MRRLYTEELPAKPRDLSVICLIVLCVLTQCSKTNSDSTVRVGSNSAFTLAETTESKPESVDLIDRIFELKSNISIFYRDRVAEKRIGIRPINIDSINSWGRTASTALPTVKITRSGKDPSRILASVNLKEAGPNGRDDEFYWRTLSLLIPITKTESEVRVEGLYLLYSDHMDLANGGSKYIIDPKSGKLTYSNNLQLANDLRSVEIELDATFHIGNPQSATNMTFAGTINLNIQ